MNIVDCGNQTPYQTTGRGEQQVQGLVLHATAGSEPFDHRIFMGLEPKHKVSIHYYVLKDGEIRQYVRDEDTAWHTGVASFHGYTNVNPMVIGVELENWNTGRDPYPEAQYNAVLALWHTKLIPDYAITRERRTRHMDIAPGRKSDPAGFPWQQFLDACYAPEISTDSCERRYRVRYDRSVVRQGPSRDYAIVGYVDAGREFWADSIKFGQVIESTDEWVHASSGVGFIHASAVERI